MKVSFTHAYEALLKLKNKDTNKVCFLLSSNFNRVKQLVDFFEFHSNRSVKRVTFTDVAKHMSYDGKILGAVAKASAVRYLKKASPEYIILEDKGDLPKSFFLMDDFCEIIREVGIKNAVIVVSKRAVELSFLYGEAEMVDVLGLNERTLKIQTSNLKTKELYLRNQCETITSGVFWVNKDFFENFMEKKMSGDKLFARGDYQNAFAKYNEAISFHNKNDEKECPINDFLRITLYVRCIACFLYGKWPERINVNKYKNQSVAQLIAKLQRSSLYELHGKMLNDYNLTFWALKDGWLEKKNYLLFLNEYIF